MERINPDQADQPDQETRNDDPLVQNQREQRATGNRDKVEGERNEQETPDERVNPEVAPRGDRKHEARGPRKPGGGRKGQPR